MGISNVSSGLRPGVCTSTTRPTNPYVGQLIFETDTASLKYWDGSVWNGAITAPTGSVQSYAGSSAPTGWLLCFGQNVSRTTYADLFAVVSTTYGAGDGSTTFGLPDLRGRVPAGLDNMGGSDAGRLDWANTLGTSGGTQTHTLTSAESGLPAHSHTTKTISNLANNNGMWHNNADTVAGGDGSTGGGLITVAQNAAANASSAHNNMQPTLLLNYIIKV
jgi:microcystin-dependent protein